MSFKSDAKRYINQYGMMAVGLMVGFGFMFGIVFSYAGMIETGSSPGGGDVNIDLPEENYAEESYGLNQQEMMFLSNREYIETGEDIIFVNAFYEDEDQKDQMRDLEDLPERFDNRVYVQLISSEQSAATGLPVDSYPYVIVLGSNPQNPAVQMDELSVQGVEDGICEVVRELGGLANQCLM